MSAPTDPVQYEPDTPYPGEQLPLLEAMKVINRFRAKYHRGIAEKHEIFSERILQRFNDGRPPAFTTPEEVPEDIAKARLTRFGSLLPQVHLTGGWMVLTWGVFPDNVITTTKRILDHPLFLVYQEVYFSVYSVGTFVSKASAEQVRHFFEARQPWQQNDYYIFDSRLQWCIGVTHDDIFVITGDFKIF